MDSGKASKTYQPGFIVLSCFVSLIGCITTLELLHRRTSTRGAYNWFLLFASSFTMGACGIWAMHFIGNRAVVLDHGRRSQQILYSSAFTVMSFFLPIIVLLKAFYLLGTTSRAKLPFIILASILTGTAVCCMHYLADYGILNYDYSYHIGNIVGSAVLAVAACLTALYIFFRLRETWTDTWWKRIACAPLLSSAVSGMHWTVAAGTEYTHKTTSSASDAINRTQTVIICSALSLATCFLLLTVVIVRGRKNRLLHNRAQQLVLACAYFDESGRVMVTPEGALPCQKITNRFVEKTFGEDELSRSHSTFLWVFRASRNWPTVKAFIPAMIGRLDSDLEARKYTPYRSSSSCRDDTSETSTNFSTVFKQLFCVAAQQLASSIHEPLEKMGALFEEPLETGMRHLTTHDSRSVSPSVCNPSRDSNKEFDLEHNTPQLHDFGRGKYLFLNRRLSKVDAVKLGALGYRFAPINQISEPLAKNMEVSNPTINSYLERMKICASPEHLLPPGVHLACFILRPSVSKSFDVLVPERTQNQLPYSSLHLDRLNGWQSAFLQRFDDWVVKDILSAIINETGSTEVEKAFLWQLHASLVQLVDLVGDTDAIMNSVFSARPFQATCRATEGIHGPATCTLLTIRLMNNIYSKSERNEMVYTPLSFFSAQQQLDSMEANSEGFTIKLTKEFGYQPSTVTRHSNRSSLGSSTKDSRDTHKDAPLLPTLMPALRRGASTARAGEESIIFSTMEERCLRAVRVSGGSTTVSEGQGLDVVVAGQEICRLSPLDSRFDDADKKFADVDMVMLPEMEYEKAGWVSDLFALFKL
ncbi:hypothetical protein DV735_g5253, partial [Chaetothyriales sp. CBS 134920]